MRSVIVVLLACACAIAISGRSLSAQPPDLDRARQLYSSAEAAMGDARYADALRDYRAAYTISKDPALLYKIGSAYQKANLCRQAVGFYAAYLRLAKATPDFFALTRERIRTCGMDPDTLPAGIEDEALGTTTNPANGSGSDAQPGSGSGSAVVDSGSAAAGSDAVDPIVSSGRAAPVKARHRGAWLFVGGAIAAATIGAVLAYSANAAENDLEDLYVGLGGNPPAFNETTKARFDDVVAEGKRYEKLSWISFGVAGVLGGIATWRFLAAEKPVQITPTASPTGAGVSAGFRF
jgi:hypothetical protein